MSVGSIGTCPQSTCRARPSGHLPMVDGRWGRRCPSVVHVPCPSQWSFSTVDGRWGHRCPSVVHGSCPSQWSFSKVDGRWGHWCPSVVVGEPPCIGTLSVTRCYWSGWVSVKKQKKNTTSTTMKDGHGPTHEEETCLHLPDRRFVGDAPYAPALLHQLPPIGPRCAVRSCPPPAVWSVMRRASLHSSSNSIGNVPCAPALLALEP